MAKLAERMTTTRWATLCETMTGPQIADLLGISPAAVHSYGRAFGRKPLPAKRGSPSTKFVRLMRWEDLCGS